MGTLTLSRLKYCKIYSKYKLIQNYMQMFCFINILFLIGSLYGSHKNLPDFRIRKNPMLQNPSFWRLDFGRKVV